MMRYVWIASSGLLVAGLGLGFLGWFTMEATLVRAGFYTDWISECETVLVALKSDKLAGDAARERALALWGSLPEKVRLALDMLG